MNVEFSDQIPTLAILTVLGFPHLDKVENCKNHCRTIVQNRASGSGIKVLVKAVC